MQSSRGPARQCRSGNHELLARFFPLTSHYHHTDFAKCPVRFTLHDVCRHKGLFRLVICIAKLAAVGLGIQLSTLVSGSRGLKSTALDQRLHPDPTTCVQGSFKSKMAAALWLKITKRYGVKRRNPSNQQDYRAVLTASKMPYGVGGPMCIRRQLPRPSELRRQTHNMN